MGHGTCHAFALPARCQSEGTNHRLCHWGHGRTCEPYDGYTCPHSRQMALVASTLIRLSQCPESTSHASPYGTEQRGLHETRGLRAALHRHQARLPWMVEHCLSVHPQLQECLCRWKQRSGLHHIPQTALPQPAAQGCTGARSVDMYSVSYDRLTLLPKLLCRAPEKFLV